MSLISIVVPSMWLWSHRQWLVDSEERLLLQAWHLRQLLPDDRETPAPEGEARTAAAWAAAG